MNKSTIKDKIDSLRGKRIRFKYNGSRNQIEEFEGVIDSTYNSIFVIKISDCEGIRSFSYNDVINKSLQIFI